MEITEIGSCGYCLIVTGNGGEEELVIQTSAGQSGHFSLQAIATACDGGRDTSKDYWRIPYSKLIGFDEMIDRIREIAKEWGASDDGATRIASEWAGNNHPNRSL